MSNTYELLEETLSLMDAEASALFDRYAIPLLNAADREKQARKRVKSAEGRMERRHAASAKAQAEGENARVARLEKEMASIQGELVELRAELEAATADNAALQERLAEDKKEMNKRLADALLARVSKSASAKKTP